MSRDGVSWEPAPELQSVITKTEPDGPGGNSVSTVADALLFSVEEVEGSLRRDPWIVEFGSGSH